MRNKYIIVGSGRLGSFIATSLSLKGENVIIIDKDITKLNYLPVNYGGLSDCADATLLETLERNDIDTCKCIICLTDKDNTNIFVAHLAKVFFSVPHIFIRLNDPNKNVLCQPLEIKTISPFALGIEEIEKLLKRIK